MSSLPYRPNVCLFILNQQLEIFIGLRSHSESIWQLPQGGAEDDLDLASNAIREAYEELGADQSKFQVIKQLSAQHQYDFRVTPDFAKGVFRGQDQTFWLLSYTGVDDESDLNRYTPEFKEWRWVRHEEFIESVEDIRRAGYLKAFPEVVSYISSQNKTKS